MKTGILLVLLVAQNPVPPLPPPPPNPSGASVQAPLDSNYAALIETCRTPPAAPGGGGAPGDKDGKPSVAYSGTHTGGVRIDMIAQGYKGRAK
jgi:hypothetical protein